MNIAKFRKEYNCENRSVYHKFVFTDISCLRNGFFNHLHDSNSFPWIILYKFRIFFYKIYIIFFILYFLLFIYIYLFFIIYILYYLALSDIEFDI